MNSEGLSTHQAFEQLVNSDYYWSLTGLPSGQRRQYSHQLRHPTKGKPWAISLDKKEEMLKKAGFKVKQEKIWLEPSGA